ncbi:hypothetical protein [Motilimonas eburnea]|uniref:hypothetical protein n=1 Tax=Motilimonas eburnea TaxID=1737488 RepID=UPI001E41FE00|nr:hypothetical protein [Motilimonas eburnea]MCE2570245.1 hypothetical protein [Motilimonas eburnea]
MTLLPNCYTDMCVNGKWFHYDHGESEVYMLNAGSPITFKINAVPNTEEELEHALRQLGEQL